MSKLAHSNDETMAIIEADAIKRGDKDAPDDCSHCGCTPEDAYRRCTTGAGRTGKPCHGETP